MKLSVVTLIMAVTAILLAGFALFTARDSAGLSISTLETISRVQQTQSIMLSNWTATTKLLNEADAVTAQMMDELYLNQELMAGFIGIEIDDETDEGQSSDTTSSGNPQDIR